MGDLELKLVQSDQSKGYVERNMSQLLELILINIKKFTVSKEDDEINDWNVSKSSAYLLSLIVQFSKIELIDNLISYVTSNIQFLI